jgi:hypothetical protein
MSLYGSFSLFLKFLRVSASLGHMDGPMGHFRAYHETAG